MTTGKMLMLILVWAAVALQPATSLAGQETHGPRRKAVRVRQKPSKAKAERAPTDAESLARALKAWGLKVEPAGEVSQPFFSVGGRAFDVEGENVQVFKYTTEAAARKEAGAVTPDGSGTATSMVSWVGTPHFYRKGGLIVLHVGDGPKVTAALHFLLGAQFAGR